MIAGLLAWYDEQPEQLAECVRCAASVCDWLVACDGAYALWPNGLPSSRPDQADAIVQAARESGMGLLLFQPPERWQGNEVGKRAAMFALGRMVTHPYADWFLVVDADEFASGEKAALLDALASTPLDVGWLNFRTTYAGSDGFVEHGARRLFRAIPNLTVIGMHWYYVGESHGRPVVLWGRDGEEEPTVDVRKLLTLEHRKLIRTTERDVLRGEWDRRREPIERLA